MQSYQEAIAETAAIREQGRMLSLRLWNQKRSGTTDNDLVERLQEVCRMWDDSATVAVELAPDLISFKRARGIAPEDGRAQTACPHYLAERMCHR